MRIAVRQAWIDQLEGRASAIRGSLPDPALVIVLQRSHDARGPVALAVELDGVHNLTVRIRNFDDVAELSAPTGDEIHHRRMRGPENRRVRGDHQVTPR